MRKVYCLVLVLTLLLGLSLSVSAAPADHSMATTGYDSADDVQYVTSGDYIYNWGVRGETATFLSSYAEKFYKGNDVYDVLSAYSGGTGTSNAPDSQLYQALQTLMKRKHTYETSYGATREMYQYTDCQNSGKDTKAISSFYSGVAIGPAWDSGKTWNREHTWPNSKGLGGNDENDIMMLRPTATSENGSRGNKAYGISSGYYYPNKESNDTMDVRGDVARIFLYVYVRWGNVDGNGDYDTWGSRGVMESLEVLLTWMEEDPVDTWEMGRNDSVQAITGTRNVFVDYPEYAWLLFGQEVPQDMVTPSGEAARQDAPAECTHENYVVKDYRPATCGEAGYSGYRCCVDCGMALTEGEPIPATGKHTLDETGHCTGCDYYEAQPCTHENVVVKDYRSATCTAFGYTGDTYCTVCGELIGLGTDIPATNHQSTVVHEQQNATCGADGYTGDTYCVDCGELLSTGERISATGAHTYGEDGKCTACGHAQEPPATEPSTQPSTRPSTQPTTQPTTPDPQPTTPATSETPEKNGNAVIWICIAIGVGLVVMVLLMRKKRK